MDMGPEFGADNDAWALEGRISIGLAKSLDSN
jgi:hypothetical protein